MSNETEAGTQALYSSSDTIDLRLKQEPEIALKGSIHPPMIRHLD